MKITAVPAGFLQPLLASITTLITDILSPSAYGDARRQKKTVVFLQKVEARVSRSATCIHVFPIGDANTFYFQGVLLASAQAGQHVQPHQRCMDPWPAFFLSTPRAKACALMRVTLIVHLLSSQCSAVMLFYRVCD